MKKLQDRIKLIAAFAVGFLTSFLVYGSNWNFEFLDPGAREDTEARIRFNENAYTKAVEVLVVESMLEGDVPPRLSHYIQHRINVFYDILESNTDNPFGENQELAEKFASGLREQGRLPGTNRGHR